MASSHHAAQMGVLERRRMMAWRDWSKRVPNIWGCKRKRVTVQYTYSEMHEYECVEAMG
jgi:hypothetical protein